MAKKKPEIEKTESKQKSGGKRMAEAGKKPVLLGLRPEQHETIKRAAKLDGRPMTQFLAHYGLEKAEEIIFRKSKEGD